MHPFTFLGCLCIGCSFCNSALQVTELEKKDKVQIWNFFCCTESKNDEDSVAPKQLVMIHTDLYFYSTQIYILLSFYCPFYLNLNIIFSELWV